MNQRDKKKIIRTMFDNLRETNTIICNSKASENRDMVDTKYVATITMLLDGSEAIKQMIIDDLEGPTDAEEVAMES